MKKILIANRGEIALRIMYSIKEMGIITIAVYSDADRDAPFVRFADEAYHIGPAPSSQSYLLGDKIIKIAKDNGVDGIHPGYGFLSENAVFAQAVTDAGIIFIGPNPDAIMMMGNKLAAKEAARRFDVPMLPGSAAAVTSTAEAIEIAKTIDFPILIKAAAGGGGKGMRVVENIEELPEQMERAVSEALSSFNDGSVFIEKYVGSPRHIEVQVLSDTHNNHLYLFERECSIQRRHQKVIEEAPSCILNLEQRKSIGESATRIARACGYVGAGTVEFLLDESGKYYFLEMNTRLQVEHPVTEMITGLDLVKEQVKIARGEELSFKQDDLTINGHAIELRIYAEDPNNNFLPDIGTLKTYRTPSGPGIRVDSGFEEGMTIPVYYDPMIAKLVVHAATRTEAIAKMIRAIDDYKIEGIKNTLSFGKYVMEHSAFSSGDFDTHFVKHYFSADKLKQKLNDDEAIVASIASLLKLNTTTTQVIPQQMNMETKTTNWRNRLKD